MTTPRYRPSGFERKPDLLVASPLQRVGAAVLDAAIAFTVPMSTVTVLLVTGNLPYCDPDTGSCYQTDEQALLSRILFWSFAAILVILVAWATGRGGSLGHRATGCKVIDVDSGELIGFRRGLVRTIVKVIGLLLLGAGWWWALTSEHRRTWHDLAARTRLISP